MSAVSLVCLIGVYHKHLLMLWLDLPTAGRSIVGWVTRLKAANDDESVGKNCTSFIPHAALQALKYLPVGYESKKDQCCNPVKNGPANID